MKWNNIKTTIHKELRGLLRDEKTTKQLILYTLLIPIIIIVFGFLFDSMEDSKYKVGINYSLSNDEYVILADIENLSMIEYKNKEELEEAYKNGDITGYIVKEENTYTIYTDSSQNSGQMVSSMAGVYLESYNMMLGTQYMVENNIDYDKVYNSILINQESLDENDTDYMGTLMFQVIVMYITMIVVIACAVVVPDLTSGEKERGTLETILTFPINSFELVFGKYLAISLLSFTIGTIGYLSSIPTLAFARKQFTTFKDITFRTDIGTILLVILIILLTALLSSGVSMALAGKSKTFKEAQSSLQVISFIPMIPYILGMMEIDNTYFTFIPIANCGLVLNDIVANSINTKNLILIILSTIVYAALILYYLSKQYKKEETLFS